MPKQSEGDSPLLAIAVKRGGVLVDAHDQTDAVLQILVDEGHPVADPEVGATSDLWRRAQLAEDDLRPVRCLSYEPNWPCFHI